MLISKLQNYGIRKENLLWLISYLTNQTQFIRYNNLDTSFQRIVCGAPLCLALGPLLFHTFANDLKDASISLDSIMFTDGTNFFILMKTLRVFFIL